MRPTDERIDATELLLGLQPDDDEPAPARKPMPMPAPPKPEPAPPSAGGADGKDVEASVGDYLDYLSQLCRDLGVPDIVEEYFAPVVGRWSALHEEATRWRAAGKAAAEVTANLKTPLGGLDAAWEGKTADSFVAYMQNVGLAGDDLADAMNSMAEVLDKTADGIREIVIEMGSILADTAEAGSQSMVHPVGGEERTRHHIDSMRRPIREFFESVKQVLEAFVKLCDGIDGAKAFEQVKMAHTFPADNWDAKIDIPTSGPGPSPNSGTDQSGTGGSKLPGGGGGGSVGGGGGGAAAAGGGGVGGGGGAATAPPPASAPPLGQGAFTAVGEMPPRDSGQAAAPAAAAAAAGKPGVGAAGMGGGMMVPPMMGGGPVGGNQDHTSKSRVVGDPEDIFGEPSEDETVPSVIGEDD